MSILSFLWGFVLGLILPASALYAGILVLSEEL